MALLLCFGMTVMAAPSVKGDTTLTVTADETVSAEYTITNDAAMESVTLTLAYDRSALTYMSGSGGDHFSGSGGNGNVTMSSRPESTQKTLPKWIRVTSPIGMERKFAANTTADITPIKTIS